MKVEYLANFVVISILLVASACASKPAVEPVKEKPVEVAVKPEPVAEVKKEPEVIAIVEQAPAIVEVKVPASIEVNFDYDSAKLTDAAMDIVVQHAAFLASHPERFVVIEGHADERGSDSYNQRLGLKRATAIRAALLLNGAKPNQLKTVSYGEKQPKLVGVGETVWRKNRRAAFKYDVDGQQMSQPSTAKHLDSEMIVSDN